MEIYNEVMSDLLSSLSTAVRDHPVPSYQTTALQVIEDDQGGVYVRGLTKHLAQNEEEALNMLFEVCKPYNFRSGISLLILSYISTDMERRFQQLRSREQRQR